MNIKIEKSWKKILNNEFKKEYFNSLVSFLKDEYKNKIIFPPGRKIFSSFDFCPFNNIKVVIIGQDPYHGINQANGLCFAVNKDIKIPPSLFNIFKEINNDIKIDIPKHGNLERWDIQGVLLLNSVLTVRKNLPRSHSNKGWENFTDRVISLISKKKKNIVFLLWGNYAKSKLKIVDQNKHLILTSSHPSPFSASNGFFNSFHFSKTNNYLKKNNIREIKW